ncbi:hypothetical protein [uncultured Gammaproteobacteria bacterium]|jgi:hypothetical protein|nr:hypothetical protein [uncultured Gammaproteobacteria bacterium]CAC9984648.1 hypothetical protein [uncultured Gammaproteobacteria bacterium]CAC9988297.1 hypothetical protein [uncultured Gammaproteobacteria bacterium]
MKNISNTLNTLTKLLAVAIFSVSLNAFSVVLGPLITFSTNHVSATAGIAITPITISNRGDSVSHYSIYPAIPDGLSLNAKTGTISGVPIVASDPVTYTVTAVGHRGHDTATIVIAVGVGVINLALRKPATQSSTYLYHSIIPVAGYAVDGNTDGYFLNKSTTHTKFEYDNPWWQVDLGSKKDIEQIIIYNRTDCCADRLKDYRVSISNKADFSTHIYQQDFHATPNPKKTIILDAPGKQGRYVRVQMFGSKILSLAEVQVIGIDPLHFSEVDYSSAHNDFGGVNNAPNYANKMAFAAIKGDGSIKAWGNPHFGGEKAPDPDSGYTKIYSNKHSFAALKADGSITAWGDLLIRGVSASRAPTDKGYIKIYSNVYAFAALKADGSITAWGNPYSGGRGAPSGSDYTEIYSNRRAFAALTHDGSVKTWGDSNFGGKDAPNAPTDKGYIKIYSTDKAFVALKADGSIKGWGNAYSGGANVPSGSDYTKIYSNAVAFAALKTDGSIKAWGEADSGGTNAPVDKGYTKIYSNTYAFAALKADGSIKGWGDVYSGGESAPVDKGYVEIYSNAYAFAALKADGSITTWGESVAGGEYISKAPTDKGYIKIYSTDRAFAALKADGSITSWGNLDSSWIKPKNDSTKGPTDKGYIKIYSNAYSFTAVKPDGSIRTWGDPSYGGTYVFGYNLALGKPATQSSTYLYYSIDPVAGYAVDGNTDGYFLNKSTTHTKLERSAWWQVDLGSKKNINQIIIYNRTDCCADRLSDYRVSISNESDFSTHTYQQDFHVAPDPKKIITLDAPGKQGRYVRIQLPDSGYLSLAEVQVMGVDL